MDLVVVLVATGHVLVYKRDSRAAVAWVGLIWLTPLLGALLYVLLGINRVRRKALRLHIDPVKVARASAPSDLPERWLERTPGLRALSTLAGKVTGLPLTAGNHVTVLDGGDEAYASMLQEIRRAERSVTLVSFIFDRDRAGFRFVEALAEAVARGVEVRVLVDDVGARASLPTIVGPLRRAGVPVARFLRSLSFHHFAFSNLRNHRKILVVDGTVGYTGGLNIREQCLLSLGPARPTLDLHFRLEGPVVDDLQTTFVEDWAFAARETLDGSPWFGRHGAPGGVFARGVNQGPDRDLEKTRTVLLGAIACASRSIRILTPYFLPDPALISSLGIAARRGVAIDILTPERPDHRIVQWARTALLWQVLEPGCRVRLLPRPFDHSKLTVVDESWTLFGSTNWDSRSLRLNFEFDVECYDPALAARLVDLFEARAARARAVTLDEVDERRLPVRLRDGAARLLTPYL